MLSAIAAIIVGFIDKIGWQWWTGHERKEVDNVQNKIEPMSAADVARGLREWQRRND